MPRLCIGGIPPFVLALCWYFAVGQAPASESFLHLNNAIVTTVSRGTSQPQVVRVNPYRNNGCAYVTGISYIDKICNYGSTSPGPITRVTGFDVFGQKDGPLTTAQFKFISDMDFYEAGKLVVVEMENDKISLVDLDAADVSLVAGKPGSRTTRDGIGSNARFRKPTAIAIDKTGGLIYISQEYNIRRVVWSNKEVSRVSGHVDNSRGKVDGSKDVARFNKIQGLAYHNNYLYATDTNNNIIRKIDATTGFATTYFGGSSGFRDGSPTTATFTFPRGISIDARSTPPVMYVVTPNHCRVRVIDMTSLTAWTVAGSSRLNQDGIGTFARFNQPYHAAVDWHSTNPRLLVTDRNNDQVRLVTRRTPNDRLLVFKTCTSSNTCGVCEGHCTSNSHCTGSLKCFKRHGYAPVPGCHGGGTGDWNNKDYCTDASSVTRYPTPAPSPLPAAVSPLMGDRSNLFVTTVLTGIEKPRYMDCDWAIGDCVVSSADENKLHRVKGGFDVSPQIVEPVGTGVRTHIDGSFAVAAFMSPGRPVLYGAVSYHPERTGHKIRKIDWQAQVVDTVTQQGSGLIDGPFNVARFRSPVGSERHTGTSMFVASDSRIQKLDFADNQVTTVAGYTEPSTPTWLRLGNRDGLCTNAKMSSPHAMSYDPSGDRLYFSSRFSFQIKVIDLGAAQCTTQVVLGRREWSGRLDGPSSIASFEGVYALRYNAEPARGTRYLYYVNVQSDRLYAFDMNANYTVTGAGSGCCKADGYASKAKFNDPYDIVMREPGISPYSFYIVDYGNNEIRMIYQLASSSPTASPATLAPSVSPSTQSPATDAPTANPTESPTTGSPVTDSPVTVSPVTTSPATSSPATSSPATLSPTESPATTSPATTSPTDSPVTISPATISPATSSPASLSPATAIPVTQSPKTQGPLTESPVTSAPATQSPATRAPVTAMPATDAPATNAPVTQSPSRPAATFNPTRSPMTASPATESPTTASPISQAPLPRGVTASPATTQPTADPTISPVTASPVTQAPGTAGPSATPTTIAPSESPVTQSPATLGPTESPVTAAPTSALTLSPTQYSATCSPLAATLEALKAGLPSTNGTDGVCGQMNRGLTGVIDAGQYTQALNAINNATARVAALQSAPESCATYLDFECDANDNVATTVRRLDTYMKAAFYRLQALVASSGGNRNGLSLVQTMIQIVKTTSLTQAERNDFSESAGNFTEGANATDLAQTTYAQDIADLLGALIERNAKAAEAESAPMYSDACGAVANAFERVERLLHKAGTALTVGGGARRLDTSMFESWSLRVDATSRGQLQPSGVTLGLPQFSYQANSAATAGDVVVLVALRWKSRVDLCRKPNDLNLVSDIHTVSALGDASRMADDVYFATGETMDMTFTARTSSSRAAQRSTGCSGPKECRWWNKATQAWDQSGCTYSETTESCRCTHLTNFAVVAPVVACPEAEAGATSSGASSMLFVAAGAGAVVIAVIVYFVLRKRSGKRYGKVRKTSSASVVPRTNSEERMHQTERGESKEGWVGSPLEASQVSVKGTSKLFGSAEKTTAKDEQYDAFLCAHGDTTPRLLALDSSSESEGISHLESHILPDFNQQPQNEASSAHGAETTNADDPNVPSEAGPAADKFATASSAAPQTSTPLEISQVGDAKSSLGNDTDSNSDEISHLESFTLPDFTKLATVPPADGSDPVEATPRLEDAPEAKEEAAHDDNDKEYMRRCKSMFMQYAQEYEMDDAMEKYDEFLSRPQDEVLAEPAHLYPAAQETGDVNSEADEAPAIEQKEETPAVESDASTSEAEPEPNAMLATPA